MHVIHALRQTGKAWIFFLGLALFYSLSPSEWGAAQTSRYLVAHAIAFEGSFAPAGIEKSTIDWSLHDGRYYSNKPPGAALLIVPPLIAARLLERAFGYDPSTQEKLHRKLADISSAAIPGALLAALILAYLSGFPSITPQTRLAALFAFAFGTIFYPYSVSAWGHQAGALFLFASFYLLTRTRSFFWAGLLFGFGELTEYTVVLTAPAFALILWNERARLRVFTLFCLGGLPAFLLFAIYHYACFGAWYHLAPLFQNPALQDSSSSLGVFNFPRKGALYDLLFGLDRGLAIVCPVFWLAPWGLYRWMRSGERKYEAIACLWAGLSFWLFTASYNGWHGGCAVGPRYFITVLPFFAPFLAWSRPGKLFFGLTALSIVNMLGTVSIGVILCPRHNLLWEQIYPEMLTRPTLLHRVLPLTAGILVLLAAGVRFLRPPVTR